MKKLISTKMKIFMVFLLIASITCFTSSLVVLYRSDFKLSDYSNSNTNWIFGWRHSYYNNFNTILLDEPLTNIKNLNIDFTGYNVTLEVHSGNNLIINSSDPSSSKENSLIINNTDDTLTISASNISRNLLVKIPSSYSNNLDFKFTEGSAIISNMTLESLKIQGINSDVNINNITLTSVNISITDGDINLNNINSKDLSVDTLDGEIFSTNLKGNINLSTSNGDIFASLTNEITNSKINTTNGDVELNLPIDNNFLIDFNTVTGELEDYLIESKFNKYDIKKHNSNSKITIGTGVIPISVTTVDGDLSF